LFEGGVVKGYVDTRGTWLRLVQFARNESEASVEIGIVENILTFTVSHGEILLCLGHFVYFLYWFIWGWRRRGF